MTRAIRPRSAAKEVTHQEFLAMPVTRQHVEVVDGAIVVMPSPSLIHQIRQGVIYRPVVAFVERHDLGLVATCPYDVLIRRTPKLRIRQPDVLFLSNARAGFRAASDPQRVQDEGIAPDLVVEILSPGQTEATRAEKLGDYASILVEEVWFADQEAKTIRVLARDGDNYRLAGEFKEGDRVVSAVLAGIDLDVSAVFA